MLIAYQPLYGNIYKSAFFLTRNGQEICVVLKFLQGVCLGKVLGCIGCISKLDRHKDRKPLRYPEVARCPWEGPSGRCG